jgi:L,D-peptidoglycan transpeptidase YkuD (ErfK/YbiS/YcfS/YnhG family)
MELFVTSDGVARFGDRIVRAALGRGGVRRDKREGDGATPAGSFACRLVYWRPDRLAMPVTGLAAMPLDPADGWCDAPGDPAYNRKVGLPYPSRAETLWRDDRLYDLIVPLGYNDAPVVAGRGSAIFLHVAREDYRPTEGCIALAPDDLTAFLCHATPETRVTVDDLG